jgi:hypothetical protein
MRSAITECRPVLLQERNPGRFDKPDAAPIFHMCILNNKIISRFRVLGHWLWLILSRYTRRVVQIGLRLS